MIYAYDYLVDVFSYQFKYEWDDDNLLKWSSDENLLIKYRVFAHPDEPDSNNLLGLMESDEANRVILNRMYKPVFITWIILKLPFSCFNPTAPNLNITRCFVIDALLSKPH